jgi:Leucine-rich repeat (LRR) protein
MPIKKLYLSGTPVRDIAPLQGMPLTDFNAIDTQIVDISPLAKSPIAMLWLTNCPVESIAPLHTIPLVSVTLKGTKVRDLTPLSGTQLQRLHIAETPVEDLSPLKGIPLTRLVFTPANIKQGLDVAKALPLAQIGTRFEEDGNDLLPPAQFWAGQGK